ncbi:CD225/dispanin family protein [Gordonia sp. PP30]|uniref:CD225/dispanin family protein n=1 Tax=Gordonia sp. PP30 TaxID=2935861 RepID=UPI001FFFDBD7|nr:CD225/dispanin family protein [Gordonia sp. PP30]UQE76061.1 CD225/dispanin family protein [Gordonia sp. PP30]
MDYTPTLLAPAAPAPRSAPTAVQRTIPVGGSHLFLPILACLCFLPAGVWSLIDARQAQRYLATGDDAAAHRCIQTSRTIALAGIGVGLAVAIVILVVALTG